MQNDWTVDWPLPPGVHAVCTSRLGGVSQSPFDTLNLGDHVGDVPAAVVSNRAHLARGMGARPVFLQQVHGLGVVELGLQTPDGTVADACWTRQSGVACTIMVADCLPVLLADRHGQVVAAAHAGWRGLAGMAASGPSADQGAWAASGQTDRADVISQTVAALCQNNGLAPSALSVWLGPCIGPRAFEVGSEVRGAFVQKEPQWQRFFEPHPQYPDKWLADLAGIARARLKDLGIHAIHGNDSSPAWCTVGQPSRFFSYRRDGVTGRFAASVWRQD